MSALLFKPGIHSTAVIEAGAKIGNNVSIGAYSFIGPGVTIKDNVRIGQNVIIVGNTTIEEGNTIYPINVLGTPGQDLKYPDYQDGVLKIGQNNIIREKCSIHASTPGHETIIGTNNFIMAETHIGHDCHIGNYTVLASVGLAGHTEIQDYAVLGAKSGFHQFCRIGRYAMIAGVAAITKDVPPFALSEHERPNEFSGLNIIGLKRKGFTKADINRIREIYDFLYDMTGAMENRIQPLREKFPGDKFATEIADFIEKSKRNLCVPGSKNPRKK